MLPTSQGTTQVARDVINQLQEPVARYALQAVAPTFCGHTDDRQQLKVVAVAMDQIAGLEAQVNEISEELLTLSS